MAYEQLKLDNQLCFRIYTASRLITQAYEPYFKPLGITYTQYIVLMVLWEKDEQPVNDIAKRLLLGINTISPLIKRMEALGLLSRKESEIDKRQQIVCLTEEGKKLKRKAANIPMCMADKLDACHIDTGKLAAMIPLLDELIEKLQGKAE
ncbi:MAG: MarR family transcriptional regulator [Phocaeicola sp.]|nr:MarR family transcriptional regulator [Phocaeicola sp.]MDD7448681.1 MarR family transcriptional regulator [Prevotellaceae bacterium]MDY5938184.1 MarR family transcriptional regulator [Phocaeicola sp.]